MVRAGNSPNHRQEWCWRVSTVKLMVGLMVTATFYGANENPSTLGMLNSESIKSCHTGRHSKTNLYSRINFHAKPNLSVVPALDKWVEEGKKVRYFELQGIIRDLRSRKRYAHALQVSEWMNSKGLCPFSPGDRAVQLDLTGSVQGLDAAESYFNNLDDKDKCAKAYGALLNCYIREGLVEKSVSHLQKMKEMGFASSPLTYNDLMCLYTNTGQFEKIPHKLQLRSKGSSFTP
ncbi:hypothetical protein L1049_001252 [Liquidambar formosana]|uniref:Pentatricopeptide repeat-containing protein n=1 Tax=Liquidambar formosana TaxID=63359 RepID=A0AAP0NAA1_LIQFO